MSSMHAAQTPSAAARKPREEIESGDLDVGDTKVKAASQSMATDMPAAAVTLGLAVINLTAQFSTTGKLLGFVALVVSIWHVTMTAKSPKTKLTPFQSQIIIAAITFVILVSRSAAGTESREDNMVPSTAEDRPLYAQRLARADGGSSVAAVSGAETANKVSLSGAHYIKSLAERGTADPLQAVVENADANTGSNDTEAKEFVLDETRRLNSSLESAAAATREEIPALLNGRIIVNTHIGESCSSACARYKYVCQPKSFAVVNTCQTLTARLSCSQCEERTDIDSVSAVLPGSNEPKSSQSSPERKCFVLPKDLLDKVECGTSNSKMRRLCPCNTQAPKTAIRG